MLESNVSGISMDYRIKNGDGEYIFEMIPDTKPLKGNTSYVISGGAENFSIVDAKKGIVQYDVIWGSSQGVIPNLEDAVVEVESVNLFFEDEGLKKIDGEWVLAVANAEAVPAVAYVMKEDASSAIQVTAARANPTSFHVTFSVAEVFEDEGPFMEMRVVDGEGNEFASDGFYMNTTRSETIISTNFPLTTYDEVDELKLIVGDIGEVMLIKN